MEQVALEIDADAIYVSKPRLPSFGVGILAKMVRNRPLVLDIDDDELAFFGEHDGISARDLLKIRGDHDVTLPFGRLWTRACDPFIAAADARTVSNPSLAERFDGIIVPHARRTTLRPPAVRPKRDPATPRHLRVATAAPVRRNAARHKGIVEVVQALEQLGDERYRVLLFGTREFDELRDTLGPLERWVTASRINPSMICRASSGPPTSRACCRIRTIRYRSTKCRRRSPTRSRCVCHAS